jgi:2-polyprenyl-3-methyl-5-hydroxy-6-metoxy-1,4-benzoquinol methylase
LRSIRSGSTRPRISPRCRGKPQPKAARPPTDYAFVAPPSQRLSVADLVPHGDTGVLVLPQAGTPASYLDGAERYLLEALRSCSDVSLFSPELRLQVHDWASLYHLTPYRATILDALGLTARETKVLELGAGCGAVTRWLGEHFDSVHAVEGSFARAHVARERTRDLPGVEVAATNFFDLAFAGAYDLATLIGVLEYSHLYHPEFRDDPWRAALSNLELVRAGLADDGMLVIAIENKLGLKYLAGAHEDHAAKQFEGIVGYPSRASAVTWSAAELERLVAQAGFTGCDFYLPFPDYKLARTVIDASSADASVYPANWVETPFPDRVAPHAPLYNESLALREVVSAGLLRDLANSFVVLAYTGDRETVRARLGVEEGWVARHYSLDRRPAFCKRTSLERSGGGLVIRNTAAVHDAPVLPSQLALTQTLSEEPYRAGHGLHFQLLELGAAGRLTEHLPALLRRLQEFLVSGWGTETFDGDGIPLLRGDALDVVWWNIICDPATGDWHAIDGEWTFGGLLPLDFVLWRGLHHFVERYRGLLGAPADGNPAEFTLASILQLIPGSSAARHPYFTELETYIQYAAGASPTTGEPAAPPASVQLLADLAAAPRSSRIVAYAEELVTHPELLDTYTAAFGPNETVTLVAYAPDADVAALVPRLEAALAAAGGDPDVVLVTVAREAAAEHRLAESAQALLSLVPATGPLTALPRVDAGESARLRELAFAA